MRGFSFACILVLRGISQVQGACEVRPGWHCADLSSSYSIYYQVGDDDRLYLHGEVQNHAGWVGIGMNGNGGMRGASVIVIRKDGETWVAEDRHAEAYAEPTMDEQQDATLESAEEVNGGINFTVSVPLNSCDDDDYPIVDLAHTVIWALGDSHSFAYHGATADVDRGATMLNLISGPQTTTDPPDSFTVDITMPDVLIEGGPNGQDPTNPYVCAAFDLSQVGGGIPTGTYHVTKYEPLIQEGNHQYVHHMIGNPCFDGPPRYVNGTNPANWFRVDCEEMIDCSGANFVWAVGGGPVVFPPEAGFPIETGAAQYFAIQMHYYNPSLTQGQTDASGFRLTMTPTLRANHVGVYTLNPGTNNRMTIPLEPGLPAVWRSLQVPASCNEDSWPANQDEINVLAVFHHEHELGTKMEINLIRDGTNMGPLRHEKMYDFRHQNFVESEFPTLKRTDSLEVKCRYDTSSKTEAVNFGDLTQMEMCFGGVYYYPAVPHGIFAEARRRDPPSASDPAGCHSFTGCLSNDHRGAKWKDYICKQGMAGKSACEHMVGGEEAFLMLWGRGWYTDFPPRGTLPEVCVNPDDKWACVKADDLGGECPSFLNVCNEFTSTCADSSACTPAEVEAFATSFCSTYCDGELWPQSEVPATEIIPYDLQPVCLVEEGDGKSAAERTMLQNPVRLALYLWGHREGGGLVEYVHENGGWDALLPSMMDLCTNHDFSGLTTGLGELLGWSGIFSSSEALNVLINWWGLCPEGCTRTGSCNATQLEEWATIGAAYACTYRQFYGYPSIYPNLVKPDTGFAEPSQITCGQLESAIQAQEIIYDGPFYNTQSCTLGNDHVCSQGVDGCKTAARAGALCPRFGICNGSYPMSTVCQPEWTSGQGWGYNEAAGQLRLCYTQDNGEFDDEESWLTGMCSHLCRGVAVEGTEAVECGEGLHVFNHINAAPPPACVPRGTPGAPTATTSTTMEGNNDGNSNDDSVGHAPSSTRCWSLSFLALTLGMRFFL